MYNEVDNLDQQLIVTIRYANELYINCIVGNVGGHIWQYRQKLLFKVDGLVFDGV